MIWSNKSTAAVCNGSEPLVRIHNKHEAFPLLPSTWRTLWAVLLCQDCRPCMTRGLFITTASLRQTVGRHVSLVVPFCGPFIRVTLVFNHMCRILLMSQRISPMSCDRWVLFVDRTWRWDQPECLGEPASSDKLTNVSFIRLNLLLQSLHPIMIVMSTSVFLSTCTFSLRGELSHFKLEKSHV